MGFKEWIQRYRNESSQIGLLAGDIALDVDFPNANDIDVLVKYLEHKEATTEYINALRLAWYNYCGEQTPSSTRSSWT